MGIEISRWVLVDNLRKHVEGYKTFTLIRYNDIRTSSKRHVTSIAKYNRFTIVCL